MEDFIPYELAIKLKQKGFDRPCIYAYCEHGGWNKYRQVHEPITHILRTDGNPFGTFYCGKNWNIKYETNKNKICCSAPTIFQILRWLREEKKIHIEPCILTDADTDADGKVINEYTYWSFSVTNIETGDMIYFEYEHIDDKRFDTYEQAALAGIEYVLDNLI